MHPERSSRIFTKIALEGTDFVVSSFGPIGEKLVSLFENLGNHPETDSFFFEDSDLSLCDLLDLARYAESKKMNFFKQYLPVILDAQVSKTLKDAKAPGGSAAFARFLRRPVRDSSRLTRKTQFVGSKTFIESVVMLWPSLPCNFLSFTKDFVFSSNSIHDSCLEEFSNMGCDFLLASASELASRFYRPQQIFGYKSLNLIDACMILAKMTGFVSDKKVLLNTKSGVFDYGASIVPMHLVPDVPEKIKNRVQDADQCRALLYDAAFDNYVLVVPTASPSESSAYLSSLEFGAPAVVMAERSGKFYFICEWN